MIDLHLHLDGSLLPEELLVLAEMQHRGLGRDFEKELSAPPDCESLKTYLRCFELPLSLMQAPELVYEAVRLLFARLGRRGMLYAEVRFAPQLHTGRGAGQEEIVSAAVLGLKASGFDGNLILCCMRGNDNLKANLETVEQAAHFFGKGVCALDIAGDEAAYPTREFSRIFEKAKSLGVPYTIHAGEAAGAESVRAAVAMGASRIGHGIRAAEDSGLMKLLRDRKIPLEMCPTSNFQTKAVVRTEDYPLKRFLEFGIVVTINTDNMTVSGTDIYRELDFAERELGAGREGIRTALENAARASFQPKGARDALLRKVREIMRGRSGVED